MSNWSTRWGLIAFLAVAFILLVLSLTTLSLVRRTIATDAQTHAFDATRATARQLDAWLQKKSDLLSQVGRLAVAYEAHNDLLRGELRTLLRSDDDLLDIYFWRPNGPGATGSGWEPPSTFDVRTRPWFISSRDPNARGISDPYTDLRSGQTTITLSRAALASDGELAGVAAIDLKLSAAARHLMLGHNPDTGRVLVFDRQGRVMVDSRGEQPQSLEDSFVLKDGSAPSDLRAALKRGEEGYFFGRPPGVKTGSEWLITYTRVPSTGWTVASYIPPNVLLRPFNLFLRGWLLVLVATVVVMLLLMLLFIDQLLLPIEHLLRLTKANRVMYTEVAAGDDLVDLTRSMNRLMAYLEAFPGVLNLMLGLKDGYTSHHTRQVAHYALAIGKRMGLNERQLGELECAALLHDIGKAGVPDVVLKKPGALTTEDWAAIRLHPVIGAEVAAEAGFTPIITQAIRQHHERLDGSGYPDRLAGEAIGLYARIIAVADIYHAMTSDRPYRPARDSVTAQAELWEGAGQRYDREVVQAFFSVLSQDPPAGTAQREAETAEAGEREDSGITEPSPA